MDLLQPFTWGANGQKTTPSSVKKYADIAAALAAKGTAPSTFGEGIARIGDALLHNSYQSRAAEGEAAGAAEVKAIMDALAGNPDPTTADYAGALGNAWVQDDPGTMAIIQAMMGEDRQQAAWAREDAQLAQQREWDLADQQTAAALDAANFKRDVKHDYVVAQDERAYQQPMFDAQVAHQIAQTEALKAKPPVSLTDDQKEYGQAVEQGYQGTLEDWILAGRRAGATSVSLGDNNSGAFGKKGDELAATRLDAIVTAGQGAAQFMGDMQALAALGAQIDTGKTAEIMNTLGPYAQALGVTIEGLGEGQAYQAIVDRLAPQMRPAGSGATSDFDARQFLSSLPGLGKTPEGNTIIMQTLSAMQQHKMAAAEIASLAFLPKEAGGITWQEAEKRIRELPNPYEGFNEYRKQGDAALAAANAQNAAAQDGVDWNAPEPPAGWEGKSDMWQYMSPEARSLWGVSK